MQLLAQGERRQELQQCHREMQERRLTLQRRAGQVCSVYIYMYISKETHL